MIPTDQSVFVGEESDCYRACLASLLEFPLEQVPNFPFREGERWLVKLNEFLRPLGMAALFLQHSSAINQPLGFTILTIGAVVGRRPHAVCCLDGVIIWDPNPFNPKIYGAKVDEVDKKFWTVFTAMNPASVRKIYNKT